MIRPFTFSDLMLLNRYRYRGHFLDSTPTLTWGRAIVPVGALLSTFSSLTGVFTSLEEGNGGDPLLGQVVHNLGSSFAHFTFLAPREKMHSPQLSELLEQLIARVGARGAQSLIAEVNEDGPAFEALRKAGFSIYARQRIWKLVRAPEGGDSGEQWRAANADDSLSVNLLCGSLVPGLVQQVEPTPWDGLSGFVQYQSGELRAYVDLRSGPRGMWMQPFVHLDVEDVEQHLAALIAQLRPRRKRPLYFCVRSYQEWLEGAVRELGAEEGPRQAVMVKRTARNVKVEERHRVIEAEGRRTEPTIPIQFPSRISSPELEMVSHD